MTSFWRRGAPVASLSLPILTWFNVNVYSAHTVKGDGMEPTLKDGDVLLVRKASFVLPQTIGSFFGWNRRRPGKSSQGTNDDDDDDDDDDEEDVHGNESSTSAAARRDERDKQLVRQVDSSVGVSPSYVFEFPPTPLPGQVVVVRSPHEFPDHHDVARVVALGGQRVRPTGRERRVETVPPMCVWLECEDAEQGHDSRTFGPVSKKLLVGNVERLVWPPSRWSKLDRGRPPYGKSWWI